MRKVQGYLRIDGSQCVREMSPSWLVLFQRQRRFLTGTSANSTLVLGTYKGRKASKPCGFRKKYFCPCIKKMKQQHLSVVMLESPHFTIVSVPFVGITLVNSEITLTQTQLAASIYSPPMPSAFNFLTTSLFPFLPSLLRCYTLFKL